MAEHLDPDTMTIEQLRAEVWFWRGNTGATLFFRLGDLEARRRPAMRDLRDQVRQLADALSSALSGDLYEGCGVCGEPLIPGQAALRECNMGDVHAACMGAPHDGDGPIKPGDLVQCDPEGVVDENDDPAPDADGVLVAYAIERLYTTDQLAEKAAKARATLARKGSRAVA